MPDACVKGGLRRTLKLAVQWRDGAFHSKQIRKSERNLNQWRVPAVSQIYYQDRPQNGNILGGDTGGVQNLTTKIKKTPNFCSRRWQDRAARGGVDASRPGKARPEPAASGDNLARLASALGLKCLHLPTQLTPAAPCGQADSAGTLNEDPVFYHTCPQKFPVSKVGGWRRRRL